MYFELVPGCLEEEGCGTASHAPHRVAAPREGFVSGANAASLPEFEYRAAAHWKSIGVSSWKHHRCYRKLFVTLSDETK